MRVRLKHACGSPARAGMGNAEPKRDGVGSVPAARRGTRLRAYRISSMRPLR